MFKPNRLAALAALPLVISAPAALADGVTIGVVAPSGGPLGILGEQVRAGAAERVSEQKNSLIAVDDSCAAGGGAAIADRLVAAKVSVAVGFLCTETLEEALPKLTEAGIPAITVGVRSDVLMADALKNGWPLFRLAPSGRAEVERLAEIIATTWSAVPFALIDDGSLGNHDLTESLRSLLEEKNVKPVLVDSLGPGQEQQLTLVRHLTSAGVVRAFVAADRDDVAVLAKSLSESEMRVSLLTGAAVATTPERTELAPGVQSLCLVDPIERPENAELIGALRAKAIEPEGYVLPVMTAMEIVDEAVPAATGEKKSVGEMLLARAYDTLSGPVRFNKDHELSENPYRLCTWSGRAFVPASEE